MKRNAFVEFNSTTLARPVGTVADYVAELQTEGLFVKGSRGRNGGVDLVEADVINTLLALVLDHDRGASVAAAVRRVRGLFHDMPPVALPEDFAQGLASFYSPTAGDMIENVIRDLRTGRFDAWAAGEAATFSVGIFADGSSVFLSLEKPQRDALDFRRAVAGYARPDFAGREKYVERQVTIGDRWFREVATALGPP